MAGFFSTLFGGGAEREAADRNRAALGLYQSNAFGAMDRGLNQTTDALRSANSGAGGYLDQNTGYFNSLRDTGTAILDRGRSDALGALNSAGGLYDPLITKYGAGTDLYLDSLGVNGAAGNTRATAAFQTGPGYDFKLNQGLDAINRRRAAGGMLSSGNADIDAITFGTGLADQTYSGWQDRLGGLISPEMAAVSGKAGTFQNIANMIGQDTAARLGLESGVTQGLTGVNNAKASNDIALGNSLAGVYQNDVNNRNSVYSGVTSGNMAANNLQSQGESQGARNALSAGMGLPSLAMGGMGGGSFGFGGGGAGGSGFFGSRFGNGTGYQTNPWSNNGMFAGGPAGASRGFFG